MQYISTRGGITRDNAKGFEEVLLSGLANDGGLFLPLSWPKFSADELNEMTNLSYQEIAFRIFSKYTNGYFSDDKLKEMINEAYATFKHPAICPLYELDNNAWLLDLNKGPTLAFKDVAMQIISRMIDNALIRRGEQSTIICATSGDTGGAAIEAFKKCKNVNVVVLHPYERVSDVQRKIMTTTGYNNIHNLAIKGDFDDCQNMVKALFSDSEFSQHHNLSAVNSINFARIMAQITYYFTSSLKIGASQNRKINFVVPTGNFGDIFAGFAALKMGLPINKLVIATNENDILYRCLKSGDYEIRDVISTQSPSMDIQISSNFERLLFDAYEGDSKKLKSLMDDLKNTGKFSLDKKALDNIQKYFITHYSTEAETKETIKSIYDDSEMMIDPHTSVGIKTYQKVKNELADPTIILSTASPAKFPQAVEDALGIKPQLPEQFSDLFKRKERYSIIDNNIKLVEEYINDSLS